MTTMFAQLDLGMNELMAYMYTDPTHHWTQNIISHFNSIDIDKSI